MEKSEIKGFIAKRCAKELKDGDVVNLGIGLPTLIPHYLPEGVEVIIHAELGIVSAGKAPKDHRHKNTPIYRFVLRPAQSASANSYFSASACMVPSAFNASKAASTAAAASLPLRKATPYSSAFSSSTIFRPA